MPYPPHVIAIVFVGLASFLLLMHKLFLDWWRERATENDRQEREREALREKLQRAREYQLEEIIREKEAQNESLRDEVKRLLARLIFTTNELRSDDGHKTQVLPPASTPGRWTPS